MVQFASYKSSIVELKKGINENLGSLELEGGELIDCKNYMLAEGGYGGYKSIPGYERFDGRYTPSQYPSVILTIKNCTTEVLSGQTLTGASSGAEVTALSDGVLLSGAYIDSNALVRVECLVITGQFIQDEDVEESGVIGQVRTALNLIGGTADYHASLDYITSIVQPVPGEGKILGVMIYEGYVFAMRKKVGLAEIGLYMEDAGDPVDGWVEVDTSADPIVYYGPNEHNVEYVEYNFYGTDTPTTYSNSLFWVDGQNQARMYNGVDPVVTVDNFGMSTLGLDKPTHIAAHNFHLFLAYREGSLQHSALGDPLVWDGVVGASEIGIGADITNLVSGVRSSLIIYSEDSTRILQGNSVDDWVLDVYSNNTGSYEKTSKRLLGTVFSIGDRGLTTLEATDQFGDYSANSISQRFKQTLFRNKRNITACITVRNLNQYRIFFEDGTGIIVSFEGREFQGATFIEYPDRVEYVAQGEDPDKNELIVFSTDNEEGYVFKMDSGKSFDGTPIQCRLGTAFYHYGSPRQRKGFKRATIEISCEDGQGFYVKTDFNYNEIGNPRTIWYTPQVYNPAGGAIWGDGEWGDMIYGSLDVTNRIPIYLQGVGTNMSYRMLSSETYREPHIIQNIITDYTQIGRQI